MNVWPVTGDDDDYEAAQLQLQFWVILAQRPKTISATRWHSTEASNIGPIIIYGVITIHVCVRPIATASSPLRTLQVEWVASIAGCTIVSGKVLVMQAVTHQQQWIKSFDGGMVGVASWCVRFIHCFICCSVIAIANIARPNHICWWNTFVCEAL